METQQQTQQLLPQQNKRIQLEPGIVPNLIGGLGNQLFIAVAAYCTGLYYRVPVYLPYVLDNAHNKNNHDYRHTILKNLGIKVEDTLQSMALKGLLNEYNYSGHQDFMPWTPGLVKPPAVLTGYYQFIGHIEIMEEDIRKQVLDGIKHLREKLIKDGRITSPSTTAFCHIRRGDYVPKSDFHYLQPIEYYRKAVGILKEMSKATTLLMFTDDIDWISKNNDFKNLGLETIIVDEKDELMAFALMTLCEAGAICANSTFSWWAAFLGCYSNKDAPICVPEKWINASVIHLFPESWHKLTI